MARWQYYHMAICAHGDTAIWVFSGGRRNQREFSPGAATSAKTETEREGMTNLMEHHRRQLLRIIAQEKLEFLIDQAKRLHEFTGKERWAHLLRGWEEELRAVKNDEISTNRLEWLADDLAR